MRYERKVNNFLLKSLEKAIKDGVDFKKTKAYLYADDREKELINEALNENNDLTEYLKLCREK